MGNFIHTMLLGDPVVKEALCCQVERESQWTNKSSTVVECRDMFNQIAETCFIPTSENTYNLETACRIELPKIKKSGKELISEH